jgi:hypothetical protein
VPIPVQTSPPSAGRMAAMADREPFSDFRCSVEVCDRPASVKGLCLSHYDRMRRTGSTGTTAIEPRMKALSCAVAGCTKRVQAKGYCKAHYDRWVRYGSAGDSLVGELRKQPRA